MASILDPQLCTIARFRVISRCLGSSPAVLGHLPRSDVICSSFGFFFGPFLDYFRPNLVLIFCFPPPETPKIEPKRRTVVRFRTFLIFSLRSLLGSILDHLGLHFGWFWYPFSLHLRIQGPIKKTRFSNRFFCDFGPILASIFEPSFTP